MRDRPKTKSQRKAWGQAQARDVAARAAAVTNPAVGQATDRLGAIGDVGRSFL